MARRSYNNFHIQVYSFFKVFCLSQSSYSIHLEEEVPKSSSKGDLAFHGKFSGSVSISPKAARFSTYSGGGWWWGGWKFSVREGEEGGVSLWVCKEKEKEKK